MDRSKYFRKVQPREARQCCSRHWKYSLGLIWPRTSASSSLGIAFASKEKDRGDGRIPYGVFVSTQIL
jgi:hypothetical protein